MTINAMIGYFENKGFKVSTRYIPKTHTYQFTIARDDTVLTREFNYPNRLKIKTSSEREWTINWMDRFIEYFETIAARKPKPDDFVDYCDADCKLTSALAKEFMNEMYKISNSSESKLIGNLTSGYTYLPGSLSFTNDLLENEIKNMKGTENMATHINNSTDLWTDLWSLKNPAIRSNATLRISNFDIDKVVFNDPATIVFWKDGTKTVVKASNESYDPEKGLAMAIAKKAYGNQGNYFNNIKKWTGVPIPIHAVKDDDFIEFIESAIECLDNRFARGRSKEYLLEDIRTAKKYLSMAVDIYRRIRCSNGIPYEIEIASKALDDAVYDTKRIKFTLILGMDKAAYNLQALVDEYKG